MAKINIMGVTQGDGQYSIDIALIRKEEIEGKLEDVAFGGDRITLLNDAKPSQVKAEIVKAAHRIMAKVKEAKRKKENLQKVEYPEIEE